ncbi:uncharacterized protein CLUP02_07843 [Colletotrichum lupini]|uniref:Uncharacterized protein n=1 Tax=Colletotrichum lupini TaxID=145971 RepID=A0A9Q8WH28_9PEZI|nr:uncharacterized protein CLUP02_07843 [Colletotrichum lupini]UQC82355.1 hypothetical protein CLUP02_07843 [Colletotrichum lupini]
MKYSRAESRCIHQAVETLSFTVHTSFPNVGFTRRACVITSPDERLKIKILIYPVSVPAEKQLHSILFHKYRREKVLITLMAFEDACGAAAGERTTAHATRHFVLFHFGIVFRLMISCVKSSHYISSLQVPASFVEQTYASTWVRSQQSTEHWASFCEAVGAVNRDKATLQAHSVLPPNQRLTESLDAPEEKETKH